MGYGGGGGGGGGSGGSGGGTGGSGGSGYRRVGDDRTANLKVDNITSRDGSSGTDVDGIVKVNTTAHFIPPSGDTRTRDPMLVTNGLTLHMDAGITSSYSGSGTQVNNIGSAGIAYTGFWEGTDASGTGPSVIFDPVEGGGSWFLEGNGTIAGRNNYLRIGMGDTTSLGMRDEYTISIWHYPTRLGASSGNGNLFLNHYQGNGTKSGIIFNITSNTAIRVQTRLNNTCCQTQTSPTGYVRSEWQNWTATWDGATKRIYLNGNEIADAQSASGTNDMLNDIYMGINADNAAGGLTNAETSAYRGYISKLMIYNRSLHETEIHQNYAIMKNRYIGIR